MFLDLIVNILLYTIGCKKILFLKSPRGKGICLSSDIYFFWGFIIYYFFNFVLNLIFYGCEIFNESQRLKRPENVQCGHDITSVILFLKYVFGY